MFLFAAITIQWLAATAPARVAAALSVCEVLANDPTKLNGKVISVRGLLGATGEGMWLVGECKTHLVTKSLQWGNDLSVYLPPDDDRATSSWERMSEKLKRLHADLSRDRVWVTILGRLETRRSMEDEVVQMPYGLRRAGFGHMGDSPAEINVMSIEDVRIEHPRLAVPKESR
jgi:hypothetical protein